MASKYLFKQFAILAGQHISKYSGYFAPKSLTKTSGIATSTNVYHSFVKHYSSNVNNNIPIVSYEEVKQLKNHPNALLIDVREPEELKETGQIPTSINIPLGQIAEELGPAIDKDAFKAKYGREKPAKNSEIIFHCKIGKRSQHAAELAKTLGFQNTKNYLGSWMEWAEKEGLPK